MFIQTLYAARTANLALVKREPAEQAGRTGDFGEYLNGFAKSPRLIVLSAISLEKL